MANESAGIGQTAYRLVVMVGSLGVGSMGAYQYGPPPEKLAGLINAALDSPQEAAAPDDELISAAADTSEAPLLDAAPASWSSPAPTADATPGLAAFEPIGESAEVLALRRDTPNGSFDRLLADVQGAGGADAKIEPWGFGDDRMYRAAATTGGARGAGPRRLDAFGESPAEASAALIAQIRSQPR